MSCHARALARTAAVVIAGALAAGCDADADADQLSRREAPVVGGASDADHAAVVAIVERRSRCDLGEDLHCSGTLIAPRVVLTAAHCLAEQRADELEVLTGATLDGASELIAVERGIVHPAYDPLAEPETQLDLALLVLERAPAGVTPALLADAPVAELAVDATLRVVGYGSTAIDQAARARLAGDAIVETVEATALWTGATGIPCSGDSGGAAFIDTADGERLVGVIKASDGACAERGLFVRIDIAVAGADFIAPTLVAIAEEPPSTRPAFDAEADFCAESCASHDDCPLGMLCLPERDGMHCGYRDLRVVDFADACDGSDAEPPCVPVGQGAARTCREVVPCGELEGSCGAGGTGAAPWLIGLAIAAAPRRGSRRRRRAPAGS